MIAFWESELEGRKVFYHSITAEDTGEDVLVIYDYCLFGFEMSSGLSREFVADIGSPTFTVEFIVCTIAGVERLDDHDQVSEGASSCSARLQFRINIERYKEMLDGGAAGTTPYDPEAAQLESPDDSFTGMLPLLTDVGMLFSRRFEHTGDRADISNAISVENRLVACTPKDDPNLPGRLTNLSISLSTSFERTGDVSDISASISTQERVIALTPEGGEDMLSSLATLSTSYMSRFSLTRDLLDVSKAISAREKVVQLQSEDDEDLPYWLDELGQSLMRRFEDEGNLLDITEAIRTQERAVHLTPGGNEKLPGRLSNLGNSYLCRFQHSTVISDISEAISLQQKAVNLVFENHKDMPILLNSLGSTLMLRFEHTGSHLDIENAIAALKKAARLASEGHEFAAAVHNNLGMALWGSFRHTGNISDISEAVSSHQKALSLISASERANCLNNLGISFRYRFEVSGDLLDICEAISSIQESISLTERHHPKMPTRLNNLATAFMERFDQRGELADMSNAIVAQRRAVDLTPEEHATMPILLNTLGSALSGRFQYTQDLEDISESISVHERAVESTSKDHIDLPLWLNNLGLSFRFRFEQTGDLEDISRAISTQKQAIKLTPESHPYLPSWLNNLGRSLMICFKSTKDRNIISEAISTHQRAIQCTPEGHGLMSNILNGLADSFLSRFEQTRDHSDLEAAISNYHQSANTVSGPPSMRLDAAKMWATCTLKLKVNPSESEVMAAFSTAIRLASQVAGLEQTIRMRHSKLIVYISDLSTTAAAAALSFGRHRTAVEWLEQGRCLVWSQISNLRTPLADLHDYNRELADRFLAVSSALEKSGSRPEVQIPDTEDNIRKKISLQNEVQEHIKLARQWEELLHNVRSIDRFHAFLQPPSTSSLLSGIPKTGLVILINVHLSRCDAIALLPGSATAIHIPLNNLSYTGADDLKRLLYRAHKSSREVEEVDSRKGGQVSHKPRKLRKILSELWLRVVEPILNQLAISVCGNLRSDANYSLIDPEIKSPTTHLRRIWWCATGPLAFLPIHAAGIYGRDKEHSQCLSDFAISSYIPTVSALIERATKKSATESPTHNSFLLVSQPNAPAPLRPIPETATEIEAIWKELCTHGVEAIRVENEAATVVRVRDNMGVHNMIHFACHGVQDISHPLQSGFIMRDGRLELSDIIKIQNLHADLAFLSACQTSTGDKDLPEEAVHLAGGMLAVGYRGVVATMWAINDKQAVAMAKDFYNYLLSNSPESGEGEGLLSARAPRALHHASERMRERLGNAEDALHAWVPYVHFGL